MYWERETFCGGMHLQEEKCNAHTKPMSSSEAGCHFKCKARSNRKEGRKQESECISGSCLPQMSWLECGVVGGVVLGIMVIIGIAFKEDR